MKVFNLALVITAFTALATASFAEGDPEKGKKPFANVSPVMRSMTVKKSWPASLWDIWVKQVQLRGSNTQKH